MQTNIKQLKFGSVESMIKAVTLSDILQEMCSKHGLTKLANEVGVESSTLSRFKNGEGNISLKDLESLLAFSETVLIEVKRYKRIIHTIITLNEMLKESLGW
jgi:transcriptional regulator with XRE-family HTH domain